jgi:hypothetical protein
LIHALIKERPCLKFDSAKSCRFCKDDHSIVENRAKFIEVIIDPDNPLGLLFQSRRSLKNHVLSLNGRRARASPAQCVSGSELGVLAVGLSDESCQASTETDSDVDLPMSEKSRPKALFVIVGKNGNGMSPASPIVIIEFRRKIRENPFPQFNCCFVLTLSHFYCFIFIQSRAMEKLKVTSVSSLTAASPDTRYSKAAPTLCEPLASGNYLNPQPIQNILAVKAKR